MSVEVKFITKLNNLLKFILYIKWMSRLFNIFFLYELQNDKFLERSISIL
jgi:hypothetical protein